MLHWSLLNEYYSLFILLILFFRYVLYEHNVTQSNRGRLFVRCLLLAMVFIILNVLTVAAWDKPDSIPIWLNTALNTVYFLISIITLSLYAFMLFDAVLEHVYDKHCLRRAKIMLAIVTSVASILTLVNLFTGWVFTVDGAGVYHRGPLNRVYYLFLFVEVFFLCVCYIRNRKSVSDRIVYVVRSIPLLTVLIGGLQLLFPDIMLNGTICSVASLIIFIAFRSNTEDNDSLTGAHSRKAFISELNLRTQSGQSIQLLQIALLNIADLNIRYNHSVGDALLYEVSHYLRHSAPHAQVFRTGGTTFTVILYLQSDESAEAQLVSIQERLQSEWVIGEISCHLEVAIAEIRNKDFSDSTAEIVEQIEYTMELAKQNPPLARFDNMIRAQMDTQNSLVSYMRKAINDNKFSVYYQPLYCCHHDIFCSAEALLRLPDENGKFISPEIFIPLAEENGMIEELTWIVLEDICKTFNSNKFPGLQSVSINLSMKQLLDPTFPYQLKERLENNGITPDRIKVEMTERFILHDSAYAKRQMELLENLGIQVFMDDFGTGYSNLSSVLAFPFSFIKLDRSLIRPILENKHAVTMVGTLVELFHDMDKKVIAEGVEILDQATVLRELGIDMIQGFYYAKPTAADNLEPYFKEENKQ